MIVAVSLLVIGGLSIVQQSVPGLWVDPYLGDGAQSFISADLDEDGLNELLLPDRVTLQRNGRFDQNLPWNLSEDAVIDVWERDVYVRFRDRLEIRRCDVDRWQTVVSQSIADAARWPWPQAYGDATDTSDAPRPARVRLNAPFLHDVDGDDVPEILLTTDAGILAYTRHGSEYAYAGLLAVYPQRAELEPYLAWDTSSGRTSMEYPQPSPFEVIVEDAGLRVSMVDATVKPRLYRAWWYDLKTNGSVLQAQLQEALKPVVLPANLEPDVLNQDNVPDLVGFTESRGSLVSGLPLLQITLTVSTDAGISMQSFEEQVIYPELVDLDGDGRKDIVTHRSGLLRGGTREVLLRALTDTNVDHEIFAWRQDTSGRYPEAPDSVWNGRLRFEHPPRKFENRFAQYGNGDLFRFGKLNRDDRVDLAVFDRPDGISLFLQSNRGFATRPVAHIKLPFDNAMFVLSDIDGNGLDDVVCMKTAGTISKGRTFEDDTVVYFVREDTP